MTSHINDYICSPLAFLKNMLMVYVAYSVCRLEYVMENWSTLGSLLHNDMWEMLKGSLLFDTSAILYTNALYAVMMLFPLHYKENSMWQRVTKGLFIIINSLAIILNLGDSVYFRYTGKRTTMSVMQEFQNENNLGKVLGTEIISHWYLFLLGFVMIAALWFFYSNPCGNRDEAHGSKGTTCYKKRNTRQWMVYYAIQLLCFALYIPLTVAGMRGGFTTAVRPITISNANQYVSRPIEGAAILNTPFSIIRTIGKNVFEDPKYYSKEELDSIYTPIHMPGDSIAQRRKNVVVLIVESFGREYIGEYNKDLDGGKYKGYTPFIDSLLQVSLTYDVTLANGRQSIDGMPSILSSIPRFIEPFFLTPASMNDVSGLAGELCKWGYSSAFFHGAENGSMGFQAFANTTGYQKYYGRTEFNQDKRFRGDNDFDGTWAIWDEPFLQFYAMKMSEMKEPYITSIFTASSHHPYVVPEQYGKTFREEGKNPIHKCIRYTDMALRRFFETAQKQPWYKNTIFVFTSDHTNISDHAEYQTDLGLYGAPIFFYDPSGEMPRGRREGIAQQIDIMPTVLNYLGYPNPYLAFGIDLLNTPVQEQWAVINTSSAYQFVKGDYMIQFDGGTNKLLSAYNYKTDRLLKNNILDGTHKSHFMKMERQLKAIIQSYMQRMTDNALIYRK